MPSSHSSFAGIIAAGFEWTKNGAKKIAGISKRGSMWGGLCCVAILMLVAVRSRLRYQEKMPSHKSVLFLTLTPLCGAFLPGIIHTLAFSGEKKQRKVQPTRIQPQVYTPN
jgi:hypothetical protein